MVDVDEDEGDIASPQHSSAEASSTSTTAGAAVTANASNPSPRMTKISRHYFSDDNSDHSAYGFSIDIIEKMQEDYGMFVWPCSIVLAEYVWQQRSRFCNEAVVELGAGTSLPGLVAAKVGADVTLTDNSSNLEVLDNMKRTCVINKLNYIRAHLGRMDVSLFSLKPKIVLGADVLYDSSDFDDLFATVTFLFQNFPGCVFITSYHNRSGHHLIEYLMVKWGWKCTKLLDAFSFMPSTKASNLHGNIQLVEIMMNDECSE